MWTSEEKRIGERIRTRRIQAALSQEALAARIGISAGYLSKIESASRRLDVRLLERIARALGCSTAELVREEISGANVSGPVPLRWIPILSKVSAGDPKEYTDGGYPPGYADSFVPCPADLTDVHAFALEIEGDSMEPRFPHGTVVICAPDRELTNGKPAVVKVKNEATTCKIFWKDGNRIILQSLNQKYPPQTISEEDLRWAYPVVKSVRNEE